jgi:hypothetical protein
VIMKFNLSLESFIGAVFAATPDRRWLFCRRSNAARIFKVASESAFPYLI